MSDFKIDFLEYIVKDILGVAQSEKWKASDQVASIHAVWMEIGRRLGKEMDKIRKMERNEK